MNATSLHIKIEPSIKEQAQKTADELGLSLSAVVKAFLREFIRTKRLSVDARSLPEIPNARTQRILKQADEDIKAGRVISFKNDKEALSYLDSLIEHDRQPTK
jgi:addiction module RelB/DinJ family antitoxin